MRRLKFRLTVGLLASFTGTSLDFYTRRPGPARECSGASAGRTTVLTVGQPPTSFAYPTETFVKP